eukprot:2244767-Pyramimonas_sp.AAC.1
MCIRDRVGPAPTAGRTKRQPAGMVAPRPATRLARKPWGAVRFGGCRWAIWPPSRATDIRR